MTPPPADPLISVIVPVYNVAPFVAAALRSISAQAHRHLQIIVVDDGSTDGSSLLCDEAAAADPRIRVIRQANAGVSAARNAGLEAAQGSYVGFVDPDDYIDPDMYATLLARLEGEDADMVSCGYVKEWPGRSRCEPSPLPPADRLLTADEALPLLLADRLLQNFLWNKLFRRALFSDIRFPAGRTFEDVAVMYRLVARARRVGLLCTAPYHYAYRPGSLTDLHLRPLRERDYFLALYERARFFEGTAHAPAATGTFLKKGIRFVDHLFLAPATAPHRAMLSEALALMHRFDRHPSVQLSFGLRLKLTLLYHLPAPYRLLYRLLKHSL